MDKTLNIALSRQKSYTLIEAMFLHQEDKG
jgi:hypothetical protein